MKPWTYQSWVRNCTIPSVPLFAIITSPARYIEGHYYSVALCQQLHAVMQVYPQIQTLKYLTVTPDPTSYLAASVDSVGLIILSVEHTSTIPILVGKPSQRSWDPFTYFYSCSHVLLMAQYEVSLAGRVSFINMQVTIIMWLACDQDCLRLRLPVQSLCTYLPQIPVVVTMWKVPQSIPIFFHMQVNEPNLPLTMISSGWVSTGLGTSSMATSWGLL